MSNSKYVALRGGLTLSTSPLDVYPGAIQDSVNWFEDTRGGYTSVGGYERYDGQRAPSDVTYYIAQFNNWDTHATDIIDNTTITVASTIAMRVLYTDTSTADTLLAVVTYVDATTIPEDLDTTPLSWDGTSYLTSITPRAEEDNDTDLIYLEAATDYARGLINVIPGDGVPAGHLQIDGRVIAFREDSGVAKFYKATSTGFVEGRFGRLLEVTGVTAGTIVAGETLDSGNFVVAGVTEWYDSGGTSDVTKAWLVLMPLATANAPPTGVTASTSGGAPYTAASVLQPISTWGDYIESVDHNFIADPAANAAWFCDGSNLLMCYSYEYNCIVPVSANYNAMAGTQATTVAVLDDQLLYSTGTGTFVISEPGNPFNYGGAYGAAEIGVGDLITAMKESDGENLMVYTKRGAKKLTGSDISNMQFKTAGGNTGALHRGVQKLDDLYSFSSRGVTQLRRTEAIGGYLGGAVSTEIAEAIEGLSSILTCSTVYPAKEQMRWYFSDSKFLSMTRLPTEEGLRYSFSFGEYPERPVKSVSTGVWPNGAERTFFTSDDGYLYEAEKGTSFDGEAIYSYLELQPNHLGNPALDKSYKRVFWEAKSNGPATLTLGFLLNYGDKSFEAKDVESFGGRYVYDQGLFDSARYDSASRSRSKANLKGRGFAITFTLDLASKFAAPVNLTGYTIQFNKLGRAKS